MYNIPKAETLMPGMRVVRVLESPESKNIYYIMVNKSDINKKHNPFTMDMVIVLIKGNTAYYINQNPDVTGANIIYDTGWMNDPFRDVK